jgi:hypothetical protein
MGKGNTQADIPAEIVTSLNKSKKVITITAKAIEKRDGPEATSSPPEDLAVLFKQLLTSLRYTTTCLSLAFKPPITPAAVDQQLKKFTDEVCRAVSFVIAAANGAGLSSTLLLTEWTDGVLDIIAEAQRYIDLVATGDYLQLTGMVWGAIDKMANLSTNESEALSKRWKEDTATIKDAWSELVEMLDAKPGLEEALDDEVLSPEERSEAERVSHAPTPLTAGQTHSRILQNTTGYATSRFCDNKSHLAQTTLEDITRLLRRIRRCRLQSPSAPSGHGIGGSARSSDRNDCRGEEMRHLDRLFAAVGGKATRGGGVMHVINLVHFRNDTGSNRSAALAQGETGSLFQRNVVHQLAHHFDIVSGHDELFVRTLGTFGESQGDGNVGGTDKQLGTIVGHEGSVTATLILGQDLYIS